MVQGPNFQNFSGRSLEDFPKKISGFSKLFWKMSLEEFRRSSKEDFGKGYVIFETSLGTS